MVKIKNSARYLIDNGLLFEINRKVLHPLGLALTVETDPDNPRWVKIGHLVSVCEGDEEGFLYDDETYDVGARKYKKFLLKEGQKKLDSRMKALGFLIQEKDSENENI